MSRADSALWTEKLTMAFKSFDLDDDGYITAKDIDAFDDRGAQALGHKPGSPQHGRYTGHQHVWRNHMMRQFGKNPNDRISLQEFLSFWGNASTDEVTQLAQESAAGVFEIADADKDDRITKDEYIRWTMAVHGASREAAEAGFAAIDANSDGYVTKDELARNMFEFTTTVADAPANKMFGPDWSTGGKKGKKP